MYIPGSRSRPVLLSPRPTERDIIEDKNELTFGMKACQQQCRVRGNPQAQEGDSDGASFAGTFLRHSYTNRVDEMMLENEAEGRMEIHVNHVKDSLKMRSISNLHVAAPVSPASPPASAAREGPASQLPVDRKRCMSTYVRSEVRAGGKGAARTLRRIPTFVTDTPETTAGTVVAVAYVMRA